MLVIKRNMQLKNCHDYSALWTKFAKRSILKMQYFINCFEEDAAILTNTNTRFGQYTGVQMTLSHNGFVTLNVIRSFHYDCPFSVSCLTRIRLKC